MIVNERPSHAQSHDLLTKDEVADLLRVSRRTLNRWMAQGRIPFFRLSPGTVRFSHAEVVTALGLNKND